MSDVNLLPCSLDTFTGLCCEILEQGRSLRFQARGQSMRPLIRDGDTLLVEPVGVDGVKVSEVVICSIRPGKLVVHRVIRKSPVVGGSRYLIQGDQATHPDGWIHQAQVYGRVTAIERHGRKILVCQPIFKFLSWMAVLRSRGSLGKGTQFINTIQWVKRLPIFYRFLIEES